VNRSFFFYVRRGRPAGLPVFSSITAASLQGLHKAYLVSTGPDLAPRPVSPRQRRLSAHMRRTSPRSRRAALRTYIERGCCGGGVARSCGRREPHLCGAVPTTETEVPTRSAGLSHEVWWGGWVLFGRRTRTNLFAAQVQSGRWRKESGRRACACMGTAFATATGGGRWPRTMLADTVALLPDTVRARLNAPKGRSNRSRGAAKTRN